MSNTITSSALISNEYDTGGNDPCDIKLMIMNDSDFTPNLNARRQSSLPTYSDPDAIEKTDLNLKDEKSAMIDLSAASQLCDTKEGKGKLLNNSLMAKDDFIDEPDVNEVKRENKSAVEIYYRRVYLRVEVYLLIIH